MTERDTTRAIDGDGHVIEDQAGIVRHLAAPYRREFEEGRLSQLFPPLDHFHGAPMQIRGGNERADRIGPEEWRAFLKSVGIERTVLYPTWALAHGKIRDRDWAVAVTRAYNEWLAEAYVSTGPEFGGMAILPLQDPPAAVRELRHAVSDLGFHGAVLPANGLLKHLADPALWPVYEEAASLGCALSVHGGCHDGLGFDDLNVYAPVHALGHPLGQLIALGALLFNGVFERWPELRVAFLEGGAAWILMALERFDESYESHVPFNDRRELLDLGGGDVGDHLADLMRSGRVIVGCEGGESDTAHVVSKLGMSPFLYSSDFPHEVTVESCIEEMKAFGELDITDEQREATLCTNAERFYRF